MRIGAPRLQEWIDSSDAIFTTVSTSFGVAPAASAARMWRRVPSACKFVQAAFTAMQISSTSLSGRMPLVHGSVVNLRACLGPARIQFAQSVERRFIPGAGLQRLAGRRCLVRRQVVRHFNTS